MMIFYRTRPQNFRLLRILIRIKNATVACGILTKTATSAAGRRAKPETITLAAGVVLFACLLTVSALAQEEPAPSQPLPSRTVLDQTVLRQKDGGSVTFQKVISPDPLPKAPTPPAVITAEEQARLDELESKTTALLTISASVHEGGITRLRWSCDGRTELEAISNVDFRLLAGMGNVETDTHYYALILAAGEDPDVLRPEQAAVAQTLSGESGPAFMLLENRPGFTPEEQQAIAAMETLHDYFDAHRDELAQRHAQREAEREARMLAERNAPPPPPRHSVIQFWPLSAAQRTQIAAKMQSAGDASNPQPSEGGVQ